MQSCYRDLFISAARTVKLSYLPVWRRHFIRRRMDDIQKWIQCGRYRVYAWSIAGMETSVVVKSNDLEVAFDMGYSSRESIKCRDVFISHGHMDHIAALPHHATKRSLFSLPRPNYYVPTHLPDLIRSVAEGFKSIDETTTALTKMSIVPLGPDDVAKLPKGYFVKSFPTVHRIPSQGYIVYKTSQQLKPEYKDQPGTDLGALHRSGVQIHDTVTTPEIAYLGDTTFEVFLSPPTPDLLKVKVIITEATYIEEKANKDYVQQARERGHTHLSEIVSNSHLFHEVDSIVIMHLSDKYSVDFVRDKCSEMIPLPFRRKVRIATLAKERTS
ncbi:uncharacterized protein [Haliotis asinina]|uniref:uncharacterized protein n=1 Tax=Haliotis asinina TaxID=109174 RepID=UPI003531E10A